MDFKSFNQQPFPAASLLHPLYSKSVQEKSRLAYLIYEPENLELQTNRFWSTNLGSEEFNFSFSGFGPGFGPFLAKHVQSSGFLEWFESVRISVLVDESGFK